MGFLSKLFGYRWSLYFVKNDNHLVYAMHQHSVIRIVGYVMRRYAKGKLPVPPWSLYLNFNKTHRSFKLRPEHFSENGDNVTPEFIREIATIDPGWQVAGGEPVLIEVATKKKIRLNSYKPGAIDLQSRLDSISEPRERTLYTILDEVFGEERP